MLSIWQHKDDNMTTPNKNNPWVKENPTNADYFQMIVEQNLRDGMPQDAAEFNAVQEMQHYMKEGINPMGPINGREAGFNASQGKALEREMQQQEQLQKAKDYEAAMTNSKGQSFGDWQVEQELARQAAVKARQNYNPYAETRADGMSFGDWQIQQTLDKQAEQAQKKAFSDKQNSEFGRWLVEQELQRQQNIQNIPSNFRNLRVVDQPPVVQPTYTGQ